MDLEFREDSSPFWAAHDDAGDVSPQALEFQGRLHVLAPPP
jgi:hypothetical protein